jgi:hypothetical protein
MIRVARYGIRVRTCRVWMQTHMFKCTPAYVHSSLRMYMCIRVLVLGRGNLHTAAAGEQGPRVRRAGVVEGGFNNHMDLTSYIHTTLNWHK